MYENLLEHAKTLHTHVANNDFAAARTYFTDETGLTVEHLHPWGNELWFSGQSYRGLSLFRLAFAMGVRNKDFLVSFAELSTGEMAYGELPPIAQAVSEAGVTHHNAYIDFLLGHSKLAQSFDRAACLNGARQREKSSRWLEVRGLIGLIERHIEARQPFSLVRLGDGEAKFVVYALTASSHALSHYERSLIGNNIWQNWFGKNITNVPKIELDYLMEMYANALGTADVLGVVDSGRLGRDTGHYGYLALQEDFVGRIDEKFDIPFFCDSIVHYQLHKELPFLEKFLSGASSLGLICPHGQLGEKIKQRFGINQVDLYLVPGERRLPTDLLAQDRRDHYPEIFLEILSTLRVRERGQIFLVAAGLLGKVYCAKIKLLGGIAIDVGSLVDGWVGYNTRPGFLDDARTFAL